MLVICDEHTGDLAQGQWAADEILQAVPGDRDTLTRLERILERADLPPNLVKVLEQHTKHAANPDEKIRIFTGSRSPAATLKDPAAAAARYEEVVHLDPDDGKALDTLGEIYTALQDYPHLARVLDAQVERVVPIAALQAEYLRQLARLVEGRSRSPGPAIAGKSWPSCCRPTRRRSIRWRGSPRRAGLAGAGQDLRAAVPLAEEPARAVTLALARAQISKRAARQRRRHRGAGAPDRRGRPAQRRGARAACGRSTNATRTGRGSVKIAERSSS